ncbi:hypothetical protein BY996DRAFT_6603564 [Phakopsora pachyrhizi]|nr:hypothetical protein BY996DRAFT_6603564 [Phakopsora pachyrhizi]
MIDLEEEAEVLDDYVAKYNIYSLNHKNNLDWIAITPHVSLNNDWSFARFLLSMISREEMIMDVAEYRKAELVEDGRFNFCANEPWAGLMTILVIERVSKNQVATTKSESDLDSSSSTESDDSGNEEPEKLEEQSSKAIEVTNQPDLDSSTESESSSDDDESDGTAVQSVYSTILGNKIDKTTTGSKRNCAIPEADSSCSSPENRPTKIRKKFMGKSILSSSKDSSKESDKTLSSSDLSSSIAAKLKITKCGKGKSSSSELSQPEDKNLESKAKADSYIT